jgi:hypothetical protein
VLATDFQEKLYSGNRVTVERVLFIPNEVPLITDRSQPNLYFGYSIRRECKLSILRETPRMEAEIQLKGHFVLQEKYH